MYEDSPPGQNIYNVIPFDIPLGQKKHVHQSALKTMCWGKHEELSRCCMTPLDTSASQEKCH